MAACLASVALALDQDGVVAGRSEQGQLVEGDDLAASLCDTLASLLGDTEGTDAQFRDLEQTQIIGDGSHDDGNVAFGGLTVLQQADDALQRDHRAIDFAHKQTLQDDLVELLVCTAVQEAVQLKEIKKTLISTGLGNFVDVLDGRRTTKNCRGEVMWEHRWT